MATYWRALWSTNVEPIRAAHESTNHTTIYSAFRDPVQSTHVRSVVDPQRATFRSAFPMPIVTAIGSANVSTERQPIGATINTAEW